MLSSFGFIGIIVVVFDLNGVKSLPVSLTKNQTPHLTTTIGDKMVVFNCNINEESGISEAIKSLEAKMEYLIGLVNKTFPQPSVPPDQGFATSCKEQYEKYKSSTSQVYTLMFGSKKVPVYCHMGNFGCGDGGWTLAMKIDGARRTFHYDAQLWSDRNSYNLEGGKTGFDMQETKLPSYWNTPFSKICLGMKIGYQIKFIVIYRHANSLFSLIADGNYRVTSLRRNTWKILIGPQASLYNSNHKEGFNAKSSNGNSKARIGILGGSKSCYYCHSRIGLGTGGRPDDSNTCGNAVYSGGDNGAKHIKAMGYFLVQ